MSLWHQPIFERWFSDASIWWCWRERSTRCFTNQLVTSHPPFTHTHTHLVALTAEIKSTRGRQQWHWNNKCPRVKIRFIQIALQSWCSSCGVHVFIHAAGIGKKKWCDVSVECAPVKETHPRQRKRCTICREIISTDLPLVPSLSGAACPRRLWLLKLSGLLWYLTHSAVELFTPKTYLKFAQYYRICRKYCRSLNCSFKKLLNGTKKVLIFSFFGSSLRVEIVDRRLF